MTKQEYLDALIELLNGASNDLSREDYGDLCREVAEDAEDRVDALEADVKEEDSAELEG
jgi:hypothetical protein